MSRSNWRPDITLGRCLLGATLIVLALVVLIPAFAEPPAHAQGGEKRGHPRNEQGRNHSPIPAFKVRSKPSIYLPDCANPKDHDQADLCQQMHMADAAEKAVRVGYIQIGVGAAAALIGTLAAIFAGWAAFAASQAAKAVIQSERAVVKMSHANGLSLEATGRAVITIHVKNWGRTPADVIGVNIGGDVLPSGDQLPAIPPYAANVGRRFGRAFLVASDEYWLRDHVLNVDREAVPQIESGQLILYLFGYVDYVDRMTGEIHRGGWGRRYHPGRPPGRNNLAFIDDAGYLYDRPRLPSEDGDWDNTT